MKIIIMMMNCNFRHALDVKNTVKCVKESLQRLIWSAHWIVIPLINYWVNCSVKTFLVDLSNLQVFFFFFPENKRITHLSWLSHNSKFAGVGTQLLMSGEICLTRTLCYLEMISVFGRDNLTENRWHFWNSNDGSGIKCAHWKLHHGTRRYF